MSWNRNEKMQLWGIVISLVGFIFVVYQIYLAIQEIEQAQVNQRAEHLSQLYFHALNSNEIKDVFQKIEY